MKKKEKDRQKRKDERKLTQTQIKRLGLLGLSAQEIREVEKVREEVRKVFRVAENARISGKKNSRNNGDSTYKQHQQRALKVATEIHLETGKKFHKITAEDVSSYIRRNYANNFSASAYIAAMGIVQMTMEQTRMYRKPPIFMTRNEKGHWSVKSDDPNRDWKRRARESTVMRPEREDIEKVLEILKNSRYEKNHKEQLEKMMRLAMMTGARASGLISLTLRDISFRKDGSVQIRQDTDSEGADWMTHHQEKGGHHRIVEYIEVRDAEAIALLNELREKFPEGTNPGRRLFEFRSKIVRDGEGEYVSGGQIMKDEKVRIKIANMVERCAERAGVNRLEIVKDEQGNEKEIYKKFTLHSCRKYFGQTRVDYRRDKMTFQQVQAEVERRIGLNQAMIKAEKERVRAEIAKGTQKHLINEIRFPNFQKKYETLLERINYTGNYVKNPDGVYKLDDNGQRIKERRTKVDRGPNKKELVFFLASLDIGHQRVDVIRFYAEYRY